MKDLTEEDYKKIILRRDPRYDGRLYFGVTTTRIYCRPICPARPKFENIIVYKSKSSAEKAGCRPCMRCRPDLAPGNRFIEPGKNIVNRCLRLMEEVCPEEKNIEALASMLGISGRHLRRVFHEELGSSPIEIMQTQRLHFARQLLLETSKPVSDIAFAAGFTSIRRFNETVKQVYRKTPSQLRESGKQQFPQDEDGLEISLMIRTPYDFASVLAFLKRHAAFGIERVVDACYERYVPVNNKSFATVRVAINKRQDALQVSLHGFTLDQIGEVLRNIRRLFDTEHNPAHLPAVLQKQASGVRVPGCYDPFEVAVSIILSQLISIEQATGKLAELIREFGDVIQNNQEILRFPSPARLMNAEIEKIGVTRTKAEAIRSLARMVHEQELVFSYSADLTQTREQLLAIKGIGPWTTELIMMRCFGDPDAYPANDLFIKKATDRHCVDENLWKTHRAYMTHYIWNDFAKKLATGESA